MKKLLLTLFALTVFAPFSVAKDKAPKAQKITGWVSNDSCGVKDSQDAACTKKCVGKGDKVVIVNDKDKSLVALDNPDALKDHWGHHVTVTGQDNNGSFHVDKVKMLAKGNGKKTPTTNEHGSGL
jgi:hypothetical protein